MLTINTYFDLLQASFVLLDLCVTIGAPLCYLIGKLLRLSIFIHANIKPSSLHPLTNVLTAGWLMSLQTCTHTKCRINTIQLTISRHFYSPQWIYRRSMMSMHTCGRRQCWRHLPCWGSGYSLEGFYTKSTSHSAPRTTSLLPCWTEGERNREAHGESWTDGVTCVNTKLHNLTPRLRNTRSVFWPWQWFQSPHQKQWQRRPWWVEHGSRRLDKSRVELCWCASEQQDDAPNKTARKGETEKHKEKVREIHITCIDQICSHTL